jgi:hypothetical protein
MVLDPGDKGGGGNSHWVGASSLLRMQVEVDFSPRGAQCNPFDVNRDAHGRRNTHQRRLARSGLFA